MKVLIIHIFFLLLTISFSQAQKVVRTWHTEDIDSLKLDSLNKEFGRNKTIPKEYQKQILLTLSYYPEIKHVHIKFKLRRRKAPFTAIPSILSTIIHSKKKRRYNIIISSYSKTLDTTTMRFIPFNGQLGVIGHELDHISFFNEKNKFGVLAVAFGNLSEKYMDRLEYNTDQGTIDHKLGWQLLDWSVYVRDALVTIYFRKWGREYRNIDFEALPLPESERYMHPQTIRKKIAENVMYKQ